MRTSALVIMLLLLGVVAVCDDATTRVLQAVLQSENVEDVVHLNEVIETPTPVPQAEYADVKGLHQAAGNAMLWITYNCNTFAGWSWTGYSTVTLDSQYRRSRWKFGFIGGELESMRPIHDRNLAHLYEDDDHGMQYGAALGVHWGKEF